MPRRRSDQLFKLVKSLSKSEKRNFKLFVKRIQSNEDVLFVKLFDLLDRAKSYDEDALRIRLGSISKQKMANLKRHLYNQILKSLRLLYTERHIEIQIREQLDNARILYEKGLYLQALRLLERTRSKAEGSQLHILHLEIVEFLKYIEERHITRSRSKEGKMEKLLHESDVLERDISNIVRLSSFKIRIHGLYITMGHARDQKDHWMVSEYFNSELEKIGENNLTVIEQIYLHQCYMWYFYILLDFENCHVHAVKWVTLFDENPNLKQEDPVLYMRGLSYVLTTLFNLKRYDEYDKWLRKFKAFNRRSTYEFSTTQEIIHFLYLNTARINKHLLEGTFKQGLRLIPEIDREIARYGEHIDIHRIMVFNYKMAWLLFGAGDYDRAIGYLNAIIQLSAGHLRTDIQCYARLLHLMAHYELGHNDLMPYMIDNVARFFSKMKDLNEVQKTILNFFKNNTPAAGLPKTQLMAFRKELDRLSKKPFERRAFQHLDIIAWVDSKINGKTLVGDSPRGIQARLIAIFQTCSC